ncbi:unnamed protein product [Cyprideis torosa]|uniref:Uncharacterized protein n=1 Tax=Cyprideis torosa TaxID=163714 RepID=A0A7R8ZJD3_9CRUS|nr:unnamed protein product [Cyprideis torosa]CAG0888357.1 unnamed protein product [Cyprideis torosa]
MEAGAVFQRSVASRLPTSAEFCLRPYPPPAMTEQRFGFGIWQPCDHYSFSLFLSGSLRREVMLLAGPSTVTALLSGNPSSKPTVRQDNHNLSNWTKTSFVVNDCPEGTPVMREAEGEKCTGLIYDCQLQQISAFVPPALWQSQNMAVWLWDMATSWRSLVIVHHDVDALAACRILLHLLRSDHALYSVVSVVGLTQLRKAFRDHANPQTQNIILVNCGGTIDLVEFLEPLPSQTVFVADSHRPLDVYNIYNASGQIRILAKVEEEEEIPTYNDIFRESESESEDSEEEEGRRRFDEDRLTKKRKRREWKERRARILFDYSQFTYFGPPTSMLMFELSWRLSKDTNELLWLSCVGLTDHFLTNKIEKENYTLLMGSLQNHVSRLNVGSQTQTLASYNMLRIAFEEDLNLYFYRHGTLFEALRHTPYTACRFRLWTIKGEKRLQEFLAELGLPLAQCRQVYSAMDVTYRGDLKTLLQSKAAKYDLDDKLVFGTFTAKIPGVRCRFSALDYALCLQAILENPSSLNNQEEHFTRALSALTDTTVLQQSIQSAKLMLTATYRQMQALLDMHQILSMGPFLFAAVGRGNPDNKYLPHQTIIGSFARFTLTAYAAMNRSSKRVRTLPLLLSIPIEKAPEGAATEGDGEEEEMLIGVPPLQEESPKNLFGKAFEQAIEGSQAKASMDFFDTSVMTLKSTDRTKFLDALVALMT